MPMDGFIFDFGNEEEDVTSQDDNGQAKGKNESGGMVHHYSLRELVSWTDFVSEYTFVPSYKCLISLLERHRDTLATIRPRF